MAASGTARGVVTSVPDWSIREQLVLASAVQRSGDQNWVSVSRAIRPVMEEPRQQQEFSQKNCATQYASMLDNASTPKRKRREDGGPEVVETVEEQIVRNLSEKRIKEIDQTLSQIKEEYMAMKKEIELIERGELDDRLHTMWQEIQSETISSDTTTKELSSQRSSPSNLAKFQVPSRQETDTSSTEPSSQQKEPKAEVKQEPPQSPPTTTQQTNTTTGSAAASNPVPASSASGSSSPCSQNSSSSKEVHQEHPYSRQEMLLSKKEKIEGEIKEQDENIHTERPVEGEAAPHDSTETKSNQKQSDENDLNAGKNDTLKLTTNDETEEKISTDVKEDTQLPKVFEEVSSLQSSNVESQDNSSASTTEEAPQTADKEETTVEESHQIVQEQSVKMEEVEEEDVEVDVETRDDDEVIQEHEEQQHGTDSVEKESADQRAVEEEKVSDREDEKDKKVETKKGEGEEEEEEIDVEDDDEDPSPVRARATRSGDGRKKRQHDVGRMLFDRIKTEKEDEREGSPSSLSSPRVRRTTRASAKKKRTTRFAKLRAEEREDSVIDSREVTDQESEEELTSAFSSSVPSPAYSQGDSAQETHHAQRSWRKTIMLVWHHASQHKFATLFLHPVREEDAPGYYEIIHKPMDLSTIKRNIETGNIKTDMEFQHAMLLMFQNALMYNSSDHDVYRMAEEMKNDVMTQIDEYLKTQKMVTSSATKALRSREGRLRPEGGGTSAEESLHKRMSIEEQLPGKKRKPRAED